MLSQLSTFFQSNEISSLRQFWECLDLFLGGRKIFWSAQKMMLNHLVFVEWHFADRTFSILKSWLSFVARPVFADYYILKAWRASVKLKVEIALFSIPPKWVLACDILFQSLRNFFGIFCSFHCIVAIKCLSKVAKRWVKFYANGIYHPSVCWSVDFLRRTNSACGLRLLLSTLTRDHTPLGTCSNSSSLLVL